MVSAWGVSIRRASGLMRMDPTTYHYRSRRHGQAAVGERCGNDNQHDEGRAMTTISIDAARVELMLTELRLPGIKAVWAKIASIEPQHRPPAVRSGPEDGPLGLQRSCPLRALTSFPRAFLARRHLQAGFHRRRQR